MISRDELYKLVWAEPMTKVAERLEVSSSYLARVCTFLNVPRPRRGYWAKVAVGRAPAKVPLPAPRLGDPQHWNREGEPIVAVKPEAPLPAATPVKRVRIGRHQIHGLIRDARAHFENTRAIEEGEYLRPYKKLLVDVTTSKTGLVEALKLANAFFKALTAAGHRVVLAPSGEHFRREPVDEREVAPKPRAYWHRGHWTPHRPTVVYVGNVAIGLSIVEMSESVMLRYLNGKYVRESEYVAPRGKDRSGFSFTTTRDLPTGRMRIVAFSPYYRVEWSRKWQEERSAPLIGRLGSIVEAVTAMAPALAAKLEEVGRQEEERHRQWEAAKRREQREQDRRCVKQSIADSKTELREVIQRWSEIVSTERFLSRVERRANELSEPDKGALLERLALARSFLGNQDPMDFILSWKTPEERYTSRFLDEQSEPADT